MDARKKERILGIGIVVVAAVLVEVISLVQSHRIREVMLDQMDTRSRAVLRGMAGEIRHTLNLTEGTMNENARMIRQFLSQPDSLLPAMVYLIDDNPHVVSGCLAFLPDYYPGKGRLFEPYAVKEGGRITVQQLGGEDHDYTLHEAFQRVMETGEPLWSDPYVYGEDSLGLTTYSYPVRDAEGRLVAVCGLDMDLAWLGSVLNAHQQLPSSFGMLLSRDGEIVAYPPAERASRETALLVRDIVNGVLPEASHPELNIRQFSMVHSPCWQVVQVFDTDEAFRGIRDMRRQQMLLILLGLGILAFMIFRYAKSEKKLLEASEEKARLSGELSVARGIQREMLPKTFPPYVSGSLESAKEVGGDLYDFIERDGKLIFCIGDVSGKGIPASMLMSEAHSLFQLLARKTHSPSGILRALNEQMCRNNDSNMFLTFFAGCLDLYSGELTYSNAGHEKPLVISRGVEELPSRANLPLGVFPDTAYQDQEIVLAPGAGLVLYTDGLTEAMDSNHHQLGLAEVRAVLTRKLSEDGNASPETLVSALREAAHTFAGAAPQSDDLTLLALRFAPENLLHEEITLERDIREIGRVNAFVKQFCAHLNLSSPVTRNIQLALEEAVVNVIQYAYPAGEKGQVQVVADSDRGKELRLTVIDSGTPFNPTSVMEADTTLDATERPIGGLGVHLIRRLMDSIGYERTAGKNILTITKKLTQHDYQS